MVLALEPARFGNGVGARVEYIVLVGAAGNEILTDHDARLERGKP